MKTAVMGLMIISLLVVCQVAGFADSQSVLEGRLLLFNDGDPTYPGIVAANEKFKAVVALGPDDPGYIEANLFYSVTRVLAFALERGSSGSLETARDLLEAFGLTRNSNLYVRIGSPYDLPTAFPEDSPTGEAVETFLAAPFVTLLDEVIGNLNTIPGTFNTTLSAIETGSEAIEVDNGDALLYKSLLYAVKSLILITTAYDLNVDIDEIKSKLDAGVFHINNDLLNRYTNFLKLRGNGANSLTKAKTALLSAIDNYNAASAFIRSETDNQSDDFISIDPEYAADEADFRALLADIKNSLTNHSLVAIGGVMVDFGEFFDDPISIRDFLPGFGYHQTTGDLIMISPLPDGTFSGIFPNGFICPACSENPVALTKFTFFARTVCECVSKASITIGTGVTVQSGATVTFKAPTVKIQSGFHAEEDAVVKIQQQ